MPASVISPVLTVITRRVYVLRTAHHNCVQCRVHGNFRCAAGGNAVQKESLERRQRAAVERGGEGSAAGVGDLGVQEDELLELRQHSCRKRRRTCRRRRRRRHARAARPSSPNGLPMRPIINSAGRRRLRPAPGPPAPRRRRCGVVQSELLIYIANVGVRFGRHAKPLYRYSECNIRIRAPSGILPTNPHDLLRPFAPTGEAAGDAQSPLSQGRQR